jgi:hypothetical protein
MEVSEPISLIEHFATLPDPRLTSKSRHKLLDIVVIAVCAGICGADDWVSVAQFGEAKQAWFPSFLQRARSALDFAPRVSGAARTPRKATHEPVAQRLRAEDRCGPELRPVYHLRTFLASCVTLPPQTLASGS